MEKLQVNIGRSNQVYSVIIGTNILTNINNFLRNNNYDNIFIITDNIIKNKLKNTIKKINHQHIISFDSGEQNKNFETYKKISVELFELGATRRSVIISLGGGVVGDIAGFAASTYMRGIDYIQVPTTLLAMVDSSIGGKVGIDLGSGKNIIGSFYQPKAVFIDVNLLDSLPQDEFLNGLAEVVKYGLIKDKKLFELLQNKQKILNKDKKLLEKIIARCCKIKKEVVEKDEQEKNLRKILNFGHTVGHAIEANSHYSIPHGQAIIIGMKIEAKLSYLMGFLDKTGYDKINQLLNSYFKININKVEINKLIELMKKDKKSSKNEIICVLPDKIGNMKTINGKFGIKVDEEIVKRAFRGAS